MHKLAEWKWLASNIKRKTFIIGNAFLALKFWRNILAKLELNYF